MLQEIYINNFVLIDEVRIELAPGLNVFTGETGAGKSIIIDALSLILGERIKGDYIRDASRKAVAEAVFDVSDNNEARIFLRNQDLLDDDSNTLIISRDIHPNGRSSVRVNGRNMTVNLLKTLGASLVDMQLQDDRHYFLNPTKYLAYIDHFLNNDDIGSDLAAIYAAWVKMKKQLMDIKQNRQARQQRKDFLDFQINEIEKSHLLAGEDEELTELKERIKNAQALMNGSSQLLELLYSSENSASAYDLIYNALEIAREMKDDSFFHQLIEPLENIYYTLEDLAGNISNFKDKLEFEPGLLQDTEDRLYEIHRLKGKYGDSIQAILDFLTQARQEKESLDLSEEQELDLEESSRQLETKYMRIAADLSNLRQEAAQRLEQQVHSQLVDLNMPYVEFKVGFQTGQPGPRGTDVVDFLFSPNPGEPLRPVEKIASGGEISRFILAMKIVLAGLYHGSAMVFDEIDVGLGGSALNSMARKIAALSRQHQIILVTHSPRMAAYADRHFHIEKYIEQGRTFTRVNKLTAEEQVTELARMLDGEDYSELSLQHARDILGSKGSLF